MSREKVQTRCDPDTVEAIDRYQEQKELSRSEAVRRLLRAGLETKADEIEGEKVTAAYGTITEGEATGPTITEEDWPALIQIVLLLLILAGVYL